MSAKFKTLVIVITLVLLGAVTLGAYAQQAETIELGALPSSSPIETLSSDGETVSIKAPPGEAEYLMDYWTLERRRAAKPLAFQPDFAEDLETSAVELVGEPGFAEGKSPRAKSNAVAKTQFPEAWDAPRGVLEPDLESDYGIGGDYGTMNVFTSYLTNYYSSMWKIYPYKSVGKLYITGGGYCSASVISTMTIVTAAHCVYDTARNTWLKGWTFVPADRNGNAPYGSYAWSRATVLTNWMGAGGRRHDVAVIRLRNNSSGRKVSYYTGWLGRSWNYSYTQNLHAQGYPSNLRSGKFTYTCTAETFKKSYDVLGMGCNMTFGSSGGPWIRKFAPYKGGYVNSVVSGGTPGINTFYGARFTSRNIVVVCNALPCD